MAKFLHAICTADTLALPPSMPHQVHCRSTGSHAWCTKWLVQYTCIRIMYGISCAHTCRVLLSRSVPQTGHMHIVHVSGEWWTTDQGHSVSAKHDRYNSPLFCNRHLLLISHDWMALLPVATAQQSFLSKDFIPLCIDCCRWRHICDCNVPRLGQKWGFQASRTCDCHAGYTSTPWNGKLLLADMIFQKKYNMW